MFEKRGSFWKKKGFYVSACVLLVGIMAVGAFFYRQTRTDGTQEKMMANIATEIPAETARATGESALEGVGREETTQANANVPPKSTMDSTSASTAKPEKTAAASADKAKEGKKDKKPVSEKKKADKKSATKKSATKTSATKTSVAKTTASPESQAQYQFNEENGLSWPVKGDVILKYSMKNTIYFETLAQYKFNPGIVISADVGARVKASADGKVTQITKDAQYGTMITTDIGNSYQLKYGQLDNLSVKEGDEVKKGDVIGSIAKPTKYFSKEGSNLYFQVIQKEESIDPLLLLE